MCQVSILEQYKTLNTDSVYITRTENINWLFIHGIEN